MSIYYEEPHTSPKKPGQQSSCPWIPRSIHPSIQTRLKYLVIEESSDLLGFGEGNLKMKNQIDFHMNESIERERERELLF